MPHLPEAGESSPTTALNRMLSAYWATQSIYAVTRLRIPDLLRDGPKSCSGLAQSAGTNPGICQRPLCVAARGRIGCAGRRKIRSQPDVRRHRRDR